ncbi:hypothetical protein JTB14_035966 [Gonioctena quinquepunctata]|nr:hypothetical protein JTB14_035966 [Gonioctena quinquepunctata]
MKKFIVLLVFLAIGISAVFADEYQVMAREDCKYGCTKTCEEKRYKYGECVNQGGFFPKYAECHCWEKTYKYNNGDDY